LDLDGAAAVEEAKELGLPPAPAVRTGDGWHKYYALPPGVEPGRRTHAGRSQKIDVLAKGYVVGPPSRHRSGRRYEWPADVDGVGLAPAPDWAVALIAERTQVAAAPAQVGAAGSMMPERLSPRMEAVLRDGHEGHYPTRSEAVAAVVFAMIGAGYRDADIVAALFARPWACDGRRNALRYFRGEIARARAAGAHPDTLEPMPSEAAVAVFRGLAPGIRLALASDNHRRRMAGAVEAAKRGVPVEALCAFEAAKNGGDVQEAQAVARWAVRTAAKEGTRHAR
jgi:hypothetical protein